MAGGDLDYYGMEHPGNHVMLGIKGCDFFLLLLWPNHGHCCLQRSVPQVDS